MFRLYSSSIFKYICNFHVNAKQHLNVLNFKYYSTHLKTYYSVLGVKPDATDGEIKEAYYSLSKKYHPDLNVGNKKAESRILEVNEAFETLGNKIEKEKYDDKMFPKVWEKQSFIYDHDERSEPPSYIFRRTPKAMSHTYEQYFKHIKGQRKTKNRHATQKLCFHKSQGSQKLPKLYKT